MNYLNLGLLPSLVGLALLVPAAMHASSSTALKRYTSGKYDSALREYKRLLLDKPDDPRLHFNAGAAAFQVNDFEEALKQLNSAVVTPDLHLQEQTYYNLGNVQYRLGAEATAPDKKKADWEQAIGNYESALKLNPKDDDAKYNLELVKKKLEELEKQQQQSKDNQKDQSKEDQQSKDDKNKENKDDKNKQEQEKNKQDQQKQQQEQQEKKTENQKPEEEQNGKKPDAPKDEQKQPENKKGEESKDHQPDKPDDQQAQAQRGVMARMTPKEAQQLLDAQKIEEKPMIFIPKLRTNRNDRVFKDW